MASLLSCSQAERDDPRSRLKGRSSLPDTEPAGQGAEEAPATRRERGKAACEQDRKMTTSPQILALFTFARRRHLGLTPSALARQLGLRPDQVRAVEAGRNAGAAAIAKLERWNGIAGVPGKAEHGR